nr:copia protein [Tanacetum cinerariifolium]
RYRGTSELVENSEEDDDEEDEEIEESLDFGSVSEDAEDEGPIIEDEGPAARDEGLAAGVEGLGIDDERHGMDDESHGLDDEGHSVESGGLSLEEEEEAVLEGQQQAASIVRTAVSAPLGLGYGALRRQELALEEDHIYNPKDGMVHIDVPAYPPPAPPVQTPPLPEWTSGSLPISPSPSVMPLLVSSPMIPLTVPSPVATPTTAETGGFLTELGAQVKMNIGELFTKSGEVRDEIFSQRYRFRSLEHEQKRAVVTFGAFWRPVLAFKAWAGRVDTWMTNMSRASLSIQLIAYVLRNILTALQRELQEMGGCVTALEREKDRKERVSHVGCVTEKIGNANSDRIVVTVRTGSKPKRKDTQVHQLSVPTESVANEAVYKELDDRLELLQVVVPSAKIPWGIQLLKLEEPKKAIHALNDTSWIEAMLEELLQFKLQDVWTLVDLPNGKRAIGTKWVFRNKKDERGIMIRNKARLVAQGHTQKERIDYDEVFSLVARIEAIRLFFAYALFEDFVVYQMDVKSGFLYRKIEEEFWSTAMAKTINREAQIHARVDGKEIIITESFDRKELRLADEEGVDCLPNSIIFENLKLMGKPKRKDTQVHQLSVPTESVANEAVYKELDDRLVRAATTVSSLEAKQDSS